MKKRLNKCLSVLIASSLTVSAAFSSVHNIFAAEGKWIEGWTGSAGSVNYAFSSRGAKSVQIENTKINNGKFTDDEDSIVYYAQETAGDNDFELKAKVTIDSYNTGDEASNPNQSSVGIAVLDEVYNKTDDKSFTNSVFLGTYAESKTDQPAFRAMLRSDSSVKTVSDNLLSESIPSTGDNLGTYDLSIKKSGNIYTLTCNDQSETIEMDGFSDTIFPCLYIARNVKATFSDISLDIETRKITELKVEGSYKQDFSYGEAFSLGDDAKVIAVYDDGSSEEITDYAVKNFSSKSVGSQRVSLVKGNARAELNVKVNNVECTKLSVEFPPVKTEYYLGTAFSSDGLQVKAEYADGRSEVLDSSQYLLYLDGKKLQDGDILNKSAKANIKVIKTDETGIKGGAEDKFSINVKKDKLVGLKVTANPKKMDYFVGDSFESAGMRVSAVYSDGNEELLKKSAYTVSALDSAEPGEKSVLITYNGSSAEAAELKLEVKERQVTGIRITSYPRTTYDVGSSFSSDDMVVSLVYDNGDTEETDAYTVDDSGFNTEEPGTTSVTIIPNDGSLKSVSLPITVTEPKEHIWRKAIFGQSAGVDQETTGNAGVTADNYGTVEGRINVRAWNATGKVTADHDGIVYYYTRVSGDSNFTLSADITVNKYLEHNNDDTKRNGQEAFGLMARDAMPFVGEDGNQTTDYSAAKKDEEGIPQAQEKSSVFASNVAIAGGYSGTSWPTDTSAASYEKNANINRINLVLRTGVEAIDGAGTKVGPNAISETFPAEGNKYRITLKRVNGGVYAKCYDYSTGKTQETFADDDNLFTVQDSDDIYVGFFGARWADFDAENIVFYESARETDQEMQSDVKAESTPSLMVTSSKYSSSTDYRLVFQPLESTGTATVRVNGKVAAGDMPVVSGDNYVDLKLEAGKKNDITITYTPDDTLPLTSYDDIIIRQDVFNKEFDTSVSTVYVSAEGSFDGDGTEDNPYDIDTAIGFLAPGQTILMEGGTYERTSPIEIELGNNGTASAMKTIMPKEGESVLIDCQRISAGAVVTGNYWRIKGLEFANSGDNLKGFHLGGSNNIIEDCIFRDNGDIGFQISRTYAEEDRSLWPSNNLVLNCESYNNCDPSMINADGFGAKLTVGEGNVFRNCSAHHNVDDGWDLYTKVNSGPIGVVTVENCISYKNGLKLMEDGTDQPFNAGGNNGFKLGGENVAVKHVLKNCISFANVGNGITTNSNPALALYDVIAYDNGKANFRLYSDKPNEYDYTVENCVSFNCGVDESDVLGTVNRDENYVNHSGDPIISEDNYFVTDLNGNSHNSANSIITRDVLNAKVRELAEAAGIELG